MVIVKTVQRLFQEVCNHKSKNIMFNLYTRAYVISLLNSQEHFCQSHSKYKLARKLSMFSYNIN